MENLPDSLDSSVKKSEYDFSTEQIHFKRYGDVDLMYLTDSAAEILNKILKEISPSDANALWPEGIRSTQKIGLTFMPTNNNGYLIGFRSSASISLGVFSFENDKVTSHEVYLSGKTFSLISNYSSFLLGLHNQIKQYEDMRMQESLGAGNLFTQIKQNVSNTLSN